jgi:hypothetical protein
MAASLGFAHHAESQHVSVFGDPDDNAIAARLVHDIKDATIDDIRAFARWAGLAGLAGLADLNGTVALNKRSYDSIRSRHRSSPFVQWPCPYSTTSAGARQNTHASPVRIS